jgi:hypothetical protein
MYFDTTEDEAGGAVDIGKRPIVIADPYRPEYVLEIRIVEANGTAVADGTLFAWVGGEWKQSAFTGGIAVAGDSPSVIEFQISKATLGNPTFLNVAVVSAGRILTRTASDVLGTDVTPADSSETVNVSSFTRIELSSD